MVNVLCGTSIGDALALPFETRSADDPFLLAWDGETFLASEYHKTQPGMGSDDTQLSVIAAKCLINHNGFNPDVLAQQYSDCLFSGTLRGYGRSTAKALTNIANGVHYTKSGVDSYGNGSIMRISPYPIFFRNDFKAMKEAVIIDNNMTHNNEEARYGALAIASFIYYLVNGWTDNIQILKMLLADIPEIELKFKLRFMQELLNQNFSIPDIIRTLGSGCRAQETVSSALCSFMYASSFKDLMSLTIRCGGDTDTNSAVAGAI